MAEPPPKTDSPFEFQSLPAGKQASVLHLSEIQAVLQSIAANKCLLTTPSFLSTAPAKSKAAVSVARKGRPPAWLDRPLFLSYIGRVPTVADLPDERLGLLQGTLEVLILRSLKPGPNHAYGISQFLQHQSDSEFLVDNGSLYPALQRLLQREWISAQWKTSPNGRRARYYSLTPAGRRQLVKATSKWQRFAVAMERILAPEG